MFTLIKEIVSNRVIVVIQYAGEDYVTTKIATVKMNNITKSNEHIKLNRLAHRYLF